MSWNFAAAIDALCRAMPADAAALVHGEARLGWRELGERTDRLAAALAAADLPRGAHVGHFMRSGPAYLETAVACGKAGLTHVNINHRYEAAELRFLFETLDVRAVVYDREFADRVAALVGVGLDLRLCVEVGDGAPVNRFARPFEALATEAAASPAAHAPAGDDLIVIATGGTTGMPKGVMWRHDDLWRALGVERNYVGRAGRPPPVASLEEHVAAVLRDGPRTVFCPLAPLMHGTGFMGAMVTLAQGGTVVTVPGARFDALAALRDIRRHGAQVVSIIGDAFGLPMADALDGHAGEALFAGVRLLNSSGTALSPHVKERFLRHAPALTILDTLGSTETMGMGSSITRRGEAAQSTRFRVGPAVKVLDEAFREVPPGSGRAGRLARAGPVPLGYYGDPELSARAFPVVDGRRFAVMGDVCRVEADGGIEFLGRGDSVINSGGEKVFVEEVERALRAVDGIADAAVAGVPHARFGTVVGAAVNALPGFPRDPATLRARLAGTLADYKIPRVVAFTDDSLRAPNGKLDYAAARRLLAAASPS
jgi:acyl-CoA synthetase (AMP-forming)/AMP-acid ligase II